MEKKQFTAEVGRVLNLMIHSLYTNKDIAVREIISNASDACDKLRYLSQINESLISDAPDLKINLYVDKDKRELYIEDTGIGMNAEDLVENLGTIAKSGTKSFLDQLTGDTKKDSQLIGQFGVGFYSSFMIADYVTVISKKASEDKAYQWGSDGQGEYEISEYNEETQRGTKIILKIKEGMDEYLDHFRLKHIIKTYSDHISAPIYYIDESKNAIQVNSASALWTRQKSDITEEQYKEFYKTVSFSPDDAWLTLHNKNEGIVEYTNLLFIPSKKTFDLYHPDRKRRVKLYIKKVFITDENIDLVPHYMRFLRGVIDSQDLPLNISRENLQYNSTIEKIRNSVTKKIISELAKKLEKDPVEYENFWNNFGSVIKEGLCEITSDPEKLLEISLFYSAKNQKLITLKQYIDSMPENDKNIYYLSGEDPKKLINSPQLEGFLGKNIDVLLFTDPVDDFWVNVVTKYKDHEIKSVTKVELESDNKKDEKSENEEKSIDQSKVLIDFFKSVLGDKVKNVIISKKLTTSPSCLSVAEGDIDIRMERFLIEQKQLNKSSAKILEINPNHPILNSIKKEISERGIENMGEDSKDIAWLLFDQACIIEGEPVSDTNLFSKRLTKLMEMV